MSEEPNQNGKKKEIVIQIDSELKTEDFEIPEALKTWKSLDEQTSEYKEASIQLDAVTTFIANMLNDGPEMKENMGKRILTFKALLKTLMTKVFVSNIDRIGILNQLVFELQYEGELRRMYQQFQAQQKEQQKKANSYVG